MYGPRYFSLAPMDSSIEDDLAILRLHQVYWLGIPQFFMLFGVLALITLLAKFWGSIEIGVSIGFLSILAMALYYWAINIEYGFLPWKRTLIFQKAPNKHGPPRVQYKLLTSVGLPYEIGYVESSSFHLEFPELKHFQSIGKKIEMHPLRLTMVRNPWPLLLPIGIWLYPYRRSFVLYETDTWCQPEFAVELIHTISRWLDESPDQVAGYTQLQRLLHQRDALGHTVSVWT